MLDANLQKNSSALGARVGLRAGAPPRTMHADIGASLGVVDEPTGMSHSGYLDETAAASSSVGYQRLGLAILRSPFS